jgi:hypothetical protein
MTSRNAYLPGIVVKVRRWDAVAGQEGTRRMWADYFDQGR